jgi:hypothetical protein
MTVTDDAWRHLPAAARAIAVPAARAVAAASERDAEALDSAVPALAVAEPGAVLGPVVRLLLEELHPAGMAGDDVRRILLDCVSAAREWQPTVDPTTVLVLLTGALGIHDRDEDAPQPDPAALARHAALLTAHLLASVRRPLAWYLTAAFAEIERAESHD